MCRLALSLAYQIEPLFVQTSDILKLFQNYSHKIEDLLFSKLCQNIRLSLSVAGVGQNPLLRFQETS